MRILIPRLQVVVARDRSRAERVLADLTPGQEVYLEALTNDLLKVSDHVQPELAHVLGVIPSEWSQRIVAAESSGRKCRAWFVGGLPFEKSLDGSFRMVLTVWCSSLTSRTGWRDLSVDELLAAARDPGEIARDGRRDAGPFRPSRIHEDGGAAPVRTPAPRAPVAAAAPRRADEAAGTAGNGTAPATTEVADKSGLSAAQVSLIKDAVRRKLAAKGD